LLPLGHARGLGAGDRVRRTGAALTVACGGGLRGRVLDGLGEPIDGAGAVAGETTARGVDADPPDALTRRRVREVLPLGVRVIDGLLTVAAGQRVGLFAGSGVGKSALLGQVVRRASADVVVVALVGERGREVREFWEDHVGDAQRRAVLVVATSDEPALVRLRAAFTATTVAEHFRDAGARVLLVMDSLTRVARAQREVGLAAGEPGVRRGLPPSVFALLPRLLERAGPGAGAGTITALYTVLVEGGDLDEPIADEVRGLLDGHVVLDRAIAARGRYPAVDVLASASRVMDAVVDEGHRAAAQRVRALLAAYEQRRDLIALGAYRAGTEATTDEAVARLPALEAFLRQGRGEVAGWEETVAAVRTLGR
ncbi:MAG: Flagellum-specific synthase FliI, partial [Myxococcaceae bacterium]|nr:Flagellum-specific synthase FliI [Myxococcaceae bacterium]